MVMVGAGVTLPAMFTPVGTSIGKSLGGWLSGLNRRSPSALRGLHHPPLSAAEAAWSSLVFAAISVGTSQPEGAHPPVAADAGDDDHTLRSDTNLTDLERSHDLNLGGVRAVLNPGPRGKT